MLSNWRKKYADSTGNTELERAHKEHKLDLYIESTLCHAAPILLLNRLQRNFLLLCTKRDLKKFLFQRNALSFKIKVHIVFLNKAFCSFMPVIIDLRHYLKKNTKTKKIIKKKTKSFIQPSLTLPLTNTNYYRKQTSL